MVALSVSPVALPQRPSHRDGDDAPRSHIFVFGSNLAGRHGAGAALHALKHHGARTAVGIGPMGRSYAIPTKGQRLEVLPLHVIAAHAIAFVAHVERNPDEHFFLTRVGCGLAGYNDSDMAPLFKGLPNNVNIPVVWEPYLMELS